MAIKAINPATGDVFESYDEAAPDAVNKIIGEVDAAFLEWRRVPIAERAIEDLSHRNDGHVASS